jgi:hypothetical protein
MGAKHVEAATGRVEEWGPLSAVATEASRASGTTGAITRAALRGRTEDGAINLAPAKEQTPEESKRGEKGKKDKEPEGPPELVVCASGNLALIYFPQLPGRVTMEEMERRWPGMISSLVQHPGVGLLMGHSNERGSMVVGKTGVHYLKDGSVTGSDPMLPYGEFAEAGLRRVDGMANCPDLVAISLLDTDTDEVAAFEELIGSHGGLGGTQTQPFIMHPSEWKIDKPLVGAEDVYRQIRTWLEANGIKLGKQRQPAAAPAPAPAAAAPAEAQAAPPPMASSPGS